MACPGHCWLRQYIAGLWYLVCINCQERRPE